MCFSLIARVRHFGCDAADSESLTKVMTRKLTHLLEPVPSGEQMLIEMMSGLCFIRELIEPSIDLASMSLGVWLADDLADWPMAIAINPEINHAE